MRERVIVNELYPLVEKALSDKKNVKEIEKIIMKFIDKNHEALSAIGPVSQIMFTDKDRDPIYKIVGITPEMERAVKKKSKDIANSGNIIGRPFNLTMAMIVRYFALHKNEDMLKLTVLYMGLSSYHNKYYKYFKFKPNEQVMAYTINNLSNKYKIKQTGNLLNAITETYHGAFLLHRKDIERGDDKDIVAFILSMDSRINSFLKRICNEFMKNHKSGNYIEYEVEDNDPENFKMASSSTQSISVLAEKVATRLIIEGPPINLVTTSAKNNNVSVNELRNYLSKIIVGEKRDEVKNMIEHILFLYLFDRKNKLEDINNVKFISYCTWVYRQSNTINENIVRIKKILDKWLEEAEIFKKTQRLATINDFRRAIYIFFVLAISYYNKI